MKDASNRAAVSGQRWEIGSRQYGIVVVEAPNWVAALGLALAEVGQDQGMDRVACERLPNGTIIVNDVSRGARFTVSPLAPELPPPGPQPQGGARYLDWMLESSSGLYATYSQDPLTSIH